MKHIIISYCYTSTQNTCTPLGQIASLYVDKYAMLSTRAKSTPQCCPRGQHWAANIAVVAAFLFKWFLFNVFCFGFEV